MSDELDIARENLAFLRTLAEDSRPLLRPLGAALLIGGLVQGLSALRFWAVGQGWIGWPEALRPWMGADGVALQVVLMLAAGCLWPSALRLPRGVTGPAGRAARGAVNAMAWALGAAAVGLLLATRRLGGAEPMATGLPIVLFALAGATWWVVHAVYRRPWALAAALASAVFAAGVGLVAGTPAGALVIAAGLVACVALPGAAMMRQSGEA